MKTKLIQCYWNNLCNIINTKNHNSLFKFFEKHKKNLKNVELSYYEKWSKFIFKINELHDKQLSYHDFTGYIKSERRRYGKLCANKRYSTVIEFNRNDQKIIWTLNPSTSLRKKISGSFKLISVLTDGNNIHILYSQNSKVRYINFDYNSIDVLIC